MSIYTISSEYVNENGGLVGYQALLQNRLKDLLGDELTPKFHIRYFSRKSRMIYISHRAEIIIGRDEVLSKALKKLQANSHVYREIPSCELTLTDVNLIYQYVPQADESINLVVGKKMGGYPSLFCAHTGFPLLICGPTLVSIAKSEYYDSIYDAVQMLNRKAIQPISKLFISKKEK